MIIDDAGRMVSTLQKEIMLKSTAEADAAAATAAVNAVDEDKWVGSRANLNLGALAIEDRYGDTVRDDFTALKGETPLHYAARAGRLEIVELMLTNVSGQVANVNAATTPAINTGFGMGETPLHYAARHGHVLVCTALLDAAPAVSSVTTTQLNLPPALLFTLLLAHPPTCWLAWWVCYHDYCRRHHRCYRYHCVPHHSTGEHRWRHNRRLDALAFRGASGAHGCRGTTADTRR